MDNLIVLHLFFFHLFGLWLGFSINNGGESGYLCVVPDLRGAASSASILSKMLALEWRFESFCHVKKCTSVHALNAF